MLQEDSLVQAGGSEDASLAYFRLGVEGRSILKSIQTEDLKLSQCRAPTQSDLHYFRARFNYYRLSIRRLPSSEARLLEPFLVKFQTRILSFESTQAPPSPTPFLEPVARTLRPIAPAGPAAKDDEESRESAEEKRPTAEAVPSAVRQLQLLQLALQAEPSVEGQRLISEGLQRVISVLSHS